MRKFVKKRVWAIWHPHLKKPLSLGFEWQIFGDKATAEKSPWCKIKGFDIKPVFVLWPESKKPKALNRKAVKKS